MTYQVKAAKLPQMQEPDYAWAIDSALSEFESELSEEIRDWFERRAIPIVTSAECSDVTIEEFAFTIDVDVNLVFDRRADAIAYMLEFGEP